MPPLKPSSNWNKRNPSQQIKKEPNKKFFFICEGLFTEKIYFDYLFSIRKKLKINNNIELIYLNKTEEHKGYSQPHKLLELAEEELIKNKNYNSKFDKVVIVFDLDVFKNKSNNNLLNIINEANKNNYILGVTNPCFELFLLLHQKNSYENIVKPNEQSILYNKFINPESSRKKRYLHNLLCKEYHINSKSNESIGNWAENIFTAINQEHFINNDIKNFENKLTSNIGVIIQNIINQ